MRFTWTSAVLVFVLGLSGPKYGGALAYFGLLVARLGVAVALGLWAVLMVVRKKRPGFRWQEVIPEQGHWQRLGAAERAAWSVFFIAVAAMCISLGVLIGTMCVYFSWRIT